MEIVEQDDRPGRRPRSTFRTILPTRACRTSSCASTFQNTSTSPSLTEMSSVARECSAYGVRKSRGFQPTVKATSYCVRMSCNQTSQCGRRVRCACDQVWFPTPPSRASAYAACGQYASRFPTSKNVAWALLRRRIARICPEYGLGPVVEGERDRVAVAASAGDDLAPREHVVERAVLRPRRRPAGPPDAGRRPLRRRHRRRDAGRRRARRRIAAFSSHTELEREHVGDDGVDVVHPVLAGRRAHLDTTRPVRATRSRGTPATGDGGRGSRPRCRRPPCAGSFGRRAPSPRIHASSATSGAHRARLRRRRFGSGIPTRTAPTERRRPGGCFRAGRSRGPR